MSVCGHARHYLGQVCNIGKHNRVGEEARIFELFFLFDRIAAFDERATESNPIEKGIVGLDLGRFGADVMPSLWIGDITQQKQCALNAAELPEGEAQAVFAIVRSELSQ